MIKQLTQEGQEYGLDEVVERVAALTTRFKSIALQASVSPKNKVAFTRASQVSPKVTATAQSMTI